MLLSILLSGLLSQSPQNPPDSLVPLPPRSGTGVLLGAQLSIVDQEAFQLGFGPALGFYHFESLNDRLAIQFEIQWKLVSGYKASTYFEDNALTPLGLGRSNADFHLRSMMFFEMPVLLKMRSGRSSRHSFFAGFRPSMNAITNSQQGSAGSFIQNGAIPTDYSELSMRKAVRQFDLGLVGGWSYDFTRHLSLDVRYTQGFIDLTADNFFKRSSNTLNSDVQVSLRANF
jgi:hypothetical protein